MAEQIGSKAESDDRGEADDGVLVAINEMSHNKRPSLKVLFAMLLTEFAAFAMLIPVLPFFLIQELGLGPSQVGQLFSAFSLAQCIGSWAWSTVSDTTGRRYLIIAVFAWSGIGFAATAFVTTLIEVLAVRVMQGLSGGTAALCDAYILDMVPSSTRASYIGLAGAVKGMAFVCGPAIGSLLIVVGLTRRMVFLVTGALAVFAAALGLAFLDESLPMEKRRPLCGKWEKGLNACEWEAVGIGLLLIWVTRFISALGLGFLFATYAFLIRDTFGWSEVHFGIVLFASGLCSACFQLLVFPRVAKAIGASWSLSLGSALGTAAFVLLPEKSIGVHICGLALFTIQGALVEPSFPVLIGMFASDRHLGFANGVTASCRALATMVSPLIAGMLYKESAWMAYYVGGACFAIASLTAAFITFHSISFPVEAEPLMSEPHGKA